MFRNPFSEAVFGCLAEGEHWNRTTRSAGGGVSESPAADICLGTTRYETVASGARIAPPGNSVEWMFE